MIIKDNNYLMFVNAESEQEVLDDMNSSEIMSAMLNKKNVYLAMTDEITKDDYYSLITTEILFELFQVGDDLMSKVGSMEYRSETLLLRKALMHILDKHHNAYHKNSMYDISLIKDYNLDFAFGWRIS